ncbi:MAG: toll/interleukin-1 receptor domain-containing protein [Nodosilinea sp.]
MSDVFISYSRADQDFVKILNAALAHSQYDAWVDWEDIPLTADWWKEIQAGIEAANTFIFVISPDSLASKVCSQEIDYAATHHKRLMPIVRRDGFDRQTVPAVLGRHNWLFFRESDDFEAAFQALVTALDTDLDHVKFHTRLLVRSREWQAANRAEDYLLRGNDLESTETWLATATSKSPSPTALQREYVYRSRQAETARQQQQQRRLKSFGVSVSALALVALAAAGVALHQRQRAIEQSNLAYQQSKLAFAHQLAVEAQTLAPSRLLSQKESRFDSQETTLAFGLASLPPELASLLAQENPRLITFSPSRNFVAVITDSFDLRVWQTSTQRSVLAWGDASAVVDVGFSPDETLLTVATQNGVLHIWQTGTSTYTAKTSLPGHTAGLTDTAFSPDGRQLATASQDGTVNLWSVADILSTAKRQVAQIRHRQPVRTVTFSPDGQNILTGSDDHTLRVWSLAGQETLCIRHDQPVRLVLFNIDGSNLGSVSGSTLVRVWPWPRLLEESSAFAGVQGPCE